MEKPINFPERGVLDAYNNGTSQERIFIERLIGGKDKLPPIDITERVKSYEDGCTELGIEPLISAPTYTPQQKKNPDREFARHQQDVLCEALNEGWEPDRNNPNEKKWVVWIEYTGSGFRFFRSAGSDQRSSVGSRLLFREERLAKYFFNQFQDIHKRAL